MNRKPITLAVGAVLSIVLFAALGLGAIVISHAATLVSSQEAENGTVSDPSLVISSTDASGGKAIKFEASNTPTPPTGWTLKWQDEPARGLGNFEAVEDDRADSHPGVTHIFARDGGYRFEMHVADRDSSTDRQRQEVLGMKQANGSYLDMPKGSTWKQTYDMFIPATLNGSPHFAHVNQLKQISLTSSGANAGSPDLPVFTLTLGGSGASSTIKMMTHYPADSSFNAVPLAPLQGKWISLDLEYKLDYAANGGYMRMKIMDGSTVVTDATKTNIEGWANAGTGTINRMRPKYGIYRYIEPDNQDTYMLLKNMKWYQKS